MVGIIFSNIYDDLFGTLSEHRTVASIPFGGRYRQIDFVLSDMVNSGINKIGVVTKYNYESLMDHLGSGQDWDLSGKTSGLYILPPFASGNMGLYRGKLEALQVAQNFLEKSTEEYAVIADCTNLMSVDFRPILEEHIRSGCDITVLANRDDCSNLEMNLVLHTDQNHRATEVLLDCNNRNGFLGLGMFIINRRLLLRVVSDSVSRGMYHLERDFIQRYFNLGQLSIHVSEFTSVVLRNSDLAAFFSNNLRLRERSVREGLFCKDMPIHTRVHDEIPAYYGKHSCVHDCVVSDGCVIRGEVTDSVFYRSVVVKEGAKIRNSIVMKDCVIDEGVELDYVILDNNVHVTKGKKLVGTSGCPLIVRKGECI